VVSTVLLLERNRLALRGLQAVLAAGAPELGVVASSAALDQALALVRAHRPRIALFGLTPCAADLELIAPLAAMPGMHLIVLVDRSAADAIDRALMLGARGVLRYQDDPEMLPRAVRAVLQGDYWIDRASLGRVVHRLTREPAADLEAARIASLTARERAVVAAVVAEAGAPTRSVARRLNLSEHTLRNHLSKIYAKLKLGNRVELYALSMKHGFGQASEERAGSSM
jgi:two-component system, NarL family, nitrate/nitrite response regulator NarL